MRAPQTSYFHYTDDIFSFMKVSAPALLPILRSDAVGEILARLYVGTPREWTLSELAASTGVSMPTLTREITRMVKAGLLEETRVGRTRVVRANRNARTYEPLERLLTLTYGPVPVIEEELRGIPGAREAYVYGSWAARHQGIEGPEPNDIDVIVIGTADPDALFDAAERARTRLHRQVDIRSVGARSWAERDSGDPFLQHVRSSPLVRLDLEAER